MKNLFVITFLYSISFFGLQPSKLNLASEFLNSLNNTQKQKAQLSFDDTSRTTWHFLPASMWERSGIPLKELNTNQKNKLFNLLETSLSDTGYEKVLKIINLENILLEQSGNAIMRDPERYYTSFYGNPESDSLWSWSFEGHHISLNFTVLDGETSMTPRFLGANPAIVLKGKQKGLRTLAKEDDLGLQLINTMSEKQLKIVIFQEQAFPDIVTKNTSKVKPLQPKGIKMDLLNNSQQSILINLINEYLNTMPTELATKRMKLITDEGLNNIHFGWAGATKLGQAHYYRIQGKTFLIEFDNTQNNANHIHTVWRDFNGDFGEDLIKLHYQKSNHHHQH